MKLEVYLLGDGNTRDLVFQDADYRPKTKGGVSALMKEASDFVLGTVALKYFKDGFGLSSSRVTVGDGVLRQRLNCGGRNVLLQDVNGRMVPVEDRSSPDRTFEIVLRLDADSLRLKPISGIRLRRLEIKNLRSIRHLVIDFRAPSQPLVLAGWNGSGKTSVLEAILHAFLKDERKLGVRPLTDQSYGIAVEFTSNTGLDYRIERTPVSHRLIEANGNILADTPFELRRIFSEMDVLFVPSWRTPPIPRAGHPTLRNLARTQDDNPVENFRLACLLEYINTRLNPKTPRYDYLNRLNDCWRRFYPERKDFFVIEDPTIRHEATKPDALTVDLYLRRPDGNERVKLIDLSSGELEVLSLVAQVMLAQSKYDLVLIDEPELHLNRVWHATIVDVLTHLDTGCPFIMATHSPEIWDAVYSWERIFLKDEEVAHD